MNHFVKNVSTNKDKSIEELNGYKPWFSKLNEKGILCWVSAFKGSDLKKDKLALIKQIHIQEKYGPIFIPSDSSLYLRSNSEEGTSNSFVSYLNAIPLSKEEIDFFASIANTLEID